MLSSLELQYDEIIRNKRGTVHKLKDKKEQLITDIECYFLPTILF